MSLVVVVAMTTNLLLLESEQVVAVAAHCLQLEQLSSSAILPKEREGAAAALEREFRERNVWISIEEATIVEGYYHQSIEDDDNVVVVVVVNNAAATAPRKIIQARSAF